MLVVASEGGVLLSEAMSWTASRRLATLITVLEAKGYQYQGNGHFLEPEWMRKKSG